MVYKLSHFPITLQIPSAYGAAVCFILKPCCVKPNISKTKDIQFTIINQLSKLPINFQFINKSFPM